MNLDAHQPAALATLVTRGEQMTQPQRAELAFVTRTHEPKCRPRLLVGVLPVDENGYALHLTAQTRPRAAQYKPVPDTPRRRGRKKETPPAPPGGDGEE